MPINLISNEEGREKEQRSSIPDLFECSIEDARTARSSELFRVHFCDPYTSTLHVPLLCSSFGFWSREAHNMLNLSVSFGPKPATSLFTWCLSLGAKQCKGIHAFVYILLPRTPHRFAIVANLEVREQTTW
jgi:hypothetical protein